MFGVFFKQEQRGTGYATGYLHERMYVRATNWGVLRSVIVWVFYPMVSWYARNASRNQRVAPKAGSPRVGAYRGRVGQGGATW